MSAVNPYQAPRAALADVAEPHQPVKVFSAAGRIGRARYIAYTIGYSLLIGLVLGFLGGLLGALTGIAVLGTAAGLLAGVLMLVMMFLLTIQRCHDFNASGWLSILVLIPLVNLMFWFIPGSEGTNRFGAPTPPNGLFVLIVAWIFPVLAIVGLIAAIALPAYLGYAQRAQQAQPR